MRRTRTESVPFGAPFRHYRLTTVPLEEDGPPTWMLGMLEDVEETSQLMRQNEEITEHLITDISQQIERCLTKMAEVVEIPLG